MSNMPLSKTKYPYSNQLTAHKRNTIGSLHKATIAIARDGKAYVWADGQFTKFTSYVCFAHKRLRSCGDAICRERPLSEIADGATPSAFLSEAARSCGAERRYDAIG
jgi:hypothetical protein